MGLCGSSLTPEERSKIQQSRELEHQIANQAKIENEKIKLLLLGAGESGKSTIFKQMKVIYGEQYSESEKKTSITNNLWKYHSSHESSYRSSSSY